MNNKVHCQLIPASSSQKFTGSKAKECKGFNNKLLNLPAKVHLFVNACIGNVRRKLDVKNELKLNDSTASS